MAEIDDVKYDVAVANRVLAELGLATGVLASLGHSSLRVPSDPNKFVVKGRGYEMDALAAMRPQDMVTVDTEGYMVDGPPGSTPCFEVKMHSCIYKLRPDVQSVTHVHPRFVVLMSTLADRLRPICQEGIEIVRRPLPVYPHVKTVQSDDEGMDVARTLGDNRVIILQGHGATTAGSSLENSVLTMLQLEEQARMNWYAYTAAGPDFPCIPDDRIAEMTERPALSELPHFKDLLAGRGGRPRVNGVWQYYTWKASQGL